MSHNASGSGSRSVPTNRQRLRLNPDESHQTERYDDLNLDFHPSLYSSLEKHLPAIMLNETRDWKVNYLKDILSGHLPPEEQIRAQRQKEYRQKILSSYQPLHKQLYTVHPTTFFEPSFISAITENTEESLRSIISEPSPGIYTFNMLQPYFCQYLLSEVQHFEKRIKKDNIRIMRPNTMNNFGVVLDDMGFEAMLHKLMEDFIRPISTAFFPEVGGSTLDSHHGFVVEYGENKDAELAFHVDDSEVTLNACLGKEFSGGELFFRGLRCDEHINTETQPEEILDYSQIPGQAVLHRGRHRHGARITRSGYRANLLIWCRSSVFRELKKYQKDFSSCCGVCSREKKEKQKHSIAEMKLVKEQEHIPDGVKYEWNKDYKSIPSHYCWQQ